MLYYEFDFFVFKTVFKKSLPLCWVLIAVEKVALHIYGLSHLKFYFIALVTCYVFCMKTGDNRCIQETHDCSSVSSAGSSSLRSWNKAKSFTITRTVC